MTIFRELAILDCRHGDPELISVKGFLALRRAGVILYEACAQETVRVHAGTGCDFIPIRTSFTDEACDPHRLYGMITSCALRYRAMVWAGNLNGFLAMGGLSVLDLARSHDVRPEIIPAVSSFQSATTASGIPLTWRGRNESFWVPEGRLVPGDAVLAAQSTASAVIPVDSLDMEETLHIFTAIRGLSEPAAVISLSGQDPDNGLVPGTLQSLRNWSLERLRQTLSFVVIGKVVEDVGFLRSSLSKLLTEFCRVEI